MPPPPSSSSSSPRLPASLTSASLSGPYDYSNLGFFGDAKNALDDADTTTTTGRLRRRRPTTRRWWRTTTAARAAAAGAGGGGEPSSRRPRFRQTTVGALPAAAAKEELGADVAVINGATIKVRKIKFFFGAKNGLSHRYPHTYLYMCI